MPLLNLPPVHLETARKENASLALASATILVLTSDRVTSQIGQHGPLATSSAELVRGCERGAVALEILSNAKGMIPTSWFATLMSAWSQSTKESMPVIRRRAILT